MKCSPRHAPVTDFHRTLFCSSNAVYLNVHGILGIKDSISIWAYMKIKDLRMLSPCAGLRNTLPLCKGL